MWKTWGQLITILKDVLRSVLIQDYGNLAFFRCIHTSILFVIILLLDNA